MCAELCQVAVWVVQADLAQCTCLDAPGSHLMLPVVHDLFKVAFAYKNLVYPAQPRCLIVVQQYQQ